jgi:AI2M/AI1M-like, HNH endonuclease
VEYDRLAYNRPQLNRLKWVMERSLVQTLAHQRRVRVSTIDRRDQTTLPTDDGARIGLQVMGERTEGQKPLIARWGGITLSWSCQAVRNDSPLQVCGPRTELEWRLQAETCELCGSLENVEVHHSRALRDLRRNGRAERPFWVQVRAARQRKTLVSCRQCHDAIPRGESPGKHAAGI